MIGDDAMPPEFPVELGADAGIRFMKDGREYRIARVDEDTWLIHQRGCSDEDFQLVVERDGSAWAVSGIAHNVAVSAIGVSKAFIFSRTF